MTKKKELEKLRTNLKDARRTVHAIESEILKHFPEHLEYHGPEAAIRVMIRYYQDTIHTHRQTRLRAIEAAEEAEKELKNARESHQKMLESQEKDFLQKLNEQARELKSIRASWQRQYLNLIKRARNALEKGLKPRANLHLAVKNVLSMLDEEESKHD